MRNALLRFLQTMYNDVLCARMYVYACVCLLYSFKYFGMYFCVLLYNEEKESEHVNTTISSTKRSDEWEAVVSGLNQ